MPRRTLPPYTCPRCGYATSQKQYMHRHLYTLKKACPSIQGVMEVTDKMKEFVMANRIWHERKATFITKEEIDAIVDIRMREYTDVAEQKITSLLGDGNK